MAQAGLHGIAGLYLAQRKPSLEGQFRYGLLLGALIPDVDFFPLALLYFFNSKLALSMHRSFTHSLLAVILVTAFFLLKDKSKSGKGFAWGLGAGMLLHIIMDIAVWFSGVDILWPLGAFGLQSKIHLWANVAINPLLPKLMGALDYLFFGLYYIYLGSLANRQGTDAQMLPFLRRATLLQWAFLVVFLALVFVLSPSLFDIAHYAMFIPIFFPLCLYITVKMRKTITCEQLDISHAA